MPTLIVSHRGRSSLAGRQQEFNVAKVTFGRKPDNTVVFNADQDRAASGNHAEINVEDGRVMLRDLGSMNGTYVNGTRIQAPTPLGPDDVVRFGTDGPEFTARLAGAAAIAATLPTSPAAAAPAAPAAPVKQGIGVMTLQRELGAVTKRERGRSRRVLMVISIGFIIALAVAGATWWIYDSNARAEQARLNAEQEQRSAELTSKQEDLKRANAETARKAEEARKLALEAGERAEAAVKKQLAGLESEMSALKGKLSNGEEQVARLIVEIQQRDETLAAIRKRQDLSEDQRQKMLDETQAKLDGLKKDLKRSEDDLRKVAEKSKAPNWAELVERYKASIFLCLIQTKPDAQGTYSQGIGTAFCIRQDGLLATNSHVAEMFIEDTDKLATAVVIQNSTGKVFPVKKALKHPRYKNPNSPDVALIVFDTGGATFTAMPLAQESDLRNLRIGTQLGTLGYPGELQGSYLSSVDNKGKVVKSAIATFKDGWIGRITNFNSETAGFSESFFIQHSASLSGGTSGSPMFTADGKVVALNNSGLDMHVLVDAGGKPDVERTPSAAQIGFAIRVDLLSELLRKSGW